METTWMPNAANSSFVNWVLGTNYFYFVFAFLFIIDSGVLARGAPWVRKSRNLSIREILVLTSAYARPSVQTGGGGGESQDNPAGGGVGQKLSLQF